MPLEPNTPIGLHQLSDEDKNQLAYFWLMRGDLERWCEWEQKKDVIARNLPQLVYAWETYKAAGRALTEICESFGNE